MIEFGDLTQAAVTLIRSAVSCFSFRLAGWCSELLGECGSALCLHGEWNLLQQQAGAFRSHW